MHERGYMIALDDFEYSGAYNDLFRLGDLVKIDFRTSPKSIEETAYVCRYSNKIMLAEKVETREEFEYAKKLGCTFMQGYYFAKPAIMSGVSAQPLPVNILEVMRLLANPDSEISAIAKVLERDSAMTQRILRLINSVYFGMSNRISTIHQAVVTLGLDCLREWIYLMGMQRILGNDSIELSRLALLHAKFCKKVSLLLPEAEKNCERIMEWANIYHICGKETRKMIAGYMLKRVEVSRGYHLRIQVNDFGIANITLGNTLID